MGQTAVTVGLLENRGWHPFPREENAFYSRSCGIPAAVSPAPDTPTGWRVVVLPAPAMLPQFSRGILPLLLPCKTLDGKSEEVLVRWYRGTCEMCCSPSRGCTNLEQNITRSGLTQPGVGLAANLLLKWLIISWGNNRNVGTWTNAQKPEWGGCLRGGPSQKGCQARTPWRSFKISNATGCILTHRSLEKCNLDALQNDDVAIGNVAELQNGKLAEFN